MNPIQVAQKSKGRLSALIIVFVALCGPAFCQSIDAEAARDQILAGVTSIHSGVQPGMMIAYGDNAYNIAWYPGGPSGGALITAAGWGQGRVIALGDHQMLNMNSYGNDSGRFYRNSIAWLAKTTSKSIKIVVSSHSGSATWLASQGYTNVVQTSSYASQLSNADVLVGWMGSSISQSNLDAITNFVKGGGGLLICEYGAGYDWWWGKPYSQAPGNRLLREVGIGFPGDIHWDSGTVDATNRANGQVTANHLVAILDDSSGYSSSKLEQAAFLLNGLFDVLAPGDPLLEELDTAFYAKIDSINPTPSSSVSDSFDKALLKREGDILSSTPPEEVTAHRTVEAVYGAIPVDAERLTRDITLFTSRGRWHATSAYAVPGELVTITVPPSLVGKGYKVRVNAHTDNISQRGSWERPPKVHRSFDIDSTEVKVANAFGGSIFIDFGGGAFGDPPNLGYVKITIANAIAQPFFKLGAHTDNAWMERLRYRPAPYTVFVSDYTILCFRSSEAANLTEPEALMTWWNEVGRLEDELANRPEVRTGAELINIDIQNSAGAAHSGFPIQAYDKHWGNPANYDSLKVQGSWGDFHELGHNHQRGWWTFSGDGEVTVNIFSSYIMQNLTSNPTGGWSWVTRPGDVMNKAISAVAESSTYSGNSSLSDRLAFWVQLADGFGWDAYKNVFRGYEIDDDTNKSKLPANNTEEKSQWLVRFSNEVGYNLTRFMHDTWGLQVSQSAIDSVSHLPDWMPVATSIKDVTIGVNSSHTFDIRRSRLSMDGVVSLISVKQPSHGTVVSDGAGKWTYSPNAGYAGGDSFEFTLRSSVGNTQTFTVSIKVSARGALMETWYDISGNEISDLTSSSRYPNNPDDVTVIQTLEAPRNRASSFGTRMRAMLVSPASGLYTFWIASDDYGELWLSSDQLPTNASLIANVNGWTGHHQWDDNEDQMSSPIWLSKGKPYYIEALMKEGSGEDHLAIAWESADIDREVIDGKHLRIFGGENNGPVFSADNYSGVDAVEMNSYSDTLVDAASDSDDGPVYYMKSAGPDWLIVTGVGDLSGIPADQDVGSNVFTIRSLDDIGAYTEATLQIEVLDVYTGHSGMGDLGSFAANWMRTGCNDMPLCSGGDLDGDGNVTLEDMMVLATNWLMDGRTGALGYWDFDEIAGVLAQDRSGNGFDGELVNMTGELAQGKSGDALVFDGVDDFVQINDYHGIGGSHSRTVSAWINTTDTEGDIVAWGAGGTPGGRWLMRTQSNGFLRVEVGGGAIEGSTPITNGQWHHVAAVLENDGSADLSEVKLYVDGIEETISNFSVRAIDTVVDPSLSPDVTIGAWLPIRRYFQGLIDEVQIFDRALSVEEITLLAQ